MRLARRAFAAALRATLRFPRRPDAGARYRFAPRMLRGLKPTSIRTNAAAHPAGSGTTNPTVYVRSSK
jgi:hypothetical protein